jgi:hypothetical protein
LISVGPSFFGVGDLDHRPGIADSGLVVNVVVQLELVEGGLDVLRGPPSTQSEAEVADHPGGDLAGEGRQAHQLQRWDSQEDICHRCHNTEGESTPDPSEQETREHRDEKKSGGYLDEINTSGYGHQADQKNENQTRHQQNRAGAGEGHLSTTGGVYGGPYHRSVVPLLLRIRLAMALLLGVFLIPVGLSSLRGLTHVVSCQGAIAQPFEVRFGEDGTPLLTGSRLIEAGSDPVCANLRTNLSMRDAGPNRLEVTVPIENRGTDPWRGTVSLVVSGVFIPVQIGLVPPGETRSETLVLRLPEGVTQFDGELLIGP